MITIEHSKDKFLLSFPYNDEDLKKVRNLPIRVWNKKEKHWEVPQLAVKSLEDLKDVYWNTEALSKKDIIEKALSKLVDLKFSEGREDPYLRKYQTSGIEYLRLAKKAVLADDMGLGKSIQAISAIISLPENSKVLIICPATLKWNWYNEFKKHFSLEPTVISGTKERRFEQWKDLEKYTVVNYDLLVRDWGAIPKTWDAIIADEAVYFKNSKSLRSKAIKKLNATYKIALSGLPIELNLMEFHSILSWVRPEVIPNAYYFKYRYCTLDWNGKIIGYKNLDEFHRLTSPFILRRTKSQVLKELPPKSYVDVPLELDSKQRQAYRAIVKEFLEWLKEQTGTTWKGNVLEKTLRMRQFVEFPSLVGFNFRSPKLEWLDELYNTVRKLAVFSFFKGSIDILRKRYNTKFVISGDVDSKDRIITVEAFNAAPSGILVSTDAGKFGINLTGVDSLVHFGLVYNPATMRQREDRLHRIGQENQVTIYTPSIIGTIDEGIQGIFLRREQDAIEIMEGSDRVSLEKFSVGDMKRLVLPNG